MFGKPRAKDLLMTKSIDGRDDDISISYLLRVYFDSGHFLLPQSPLSIVNVDLEVNKDVSHSSLSLYLVEHSRQLNVVSGNVFSNGSGEVSSFFES